MHGQAELARLFRVVRPCTVELHESREAPSRAASVIFGAIVEEYLVTARPRGVHVGPATNPERPCVRSRAGWRN